MTVGHSLAMLLIDKSATKRALCGAPAVVVDCRVQCSSKVLRGSAVIDVPAETSPALSQQRPQQFTLEVTLATSVGCLPPSTPRLQPGSQKGQAARCMSSASLPCNQLCVAIGCAAVHSTAAFKLA